MKKICFTLVLILICSTISVRADNLSVSARYACVMDSLTGKVLFEKDAYTKYSMASTTKIMTALVALEYGKADDIVTVTPNAAKTEGSSIYLRAGEKIKLEDLLYGLMLESGNDAAVAIAEHVGGSAEKFASMMTEKAKEIGAKNSQFKNPNGLDQDGHYTTAYDLALITRYALKNPTFAQIVTTKRKTISNGEETYGRALSNHNKLLNLYNGCQGVKTGYTKKTGRCLVSAATKNHVQAIAVTLNAPNDWNDHKNMLDYVFENYSARPLILKDMVVKTIPIKNGDSEGIQLKAQDEFYLSIENKEVLSKVKIEYHVPSKLTAPIQEGAEIGTVKVFYGKELMKEIPLVAGQTVEYVTPPKPTFLDNIKKLFGGWLNFQ